MEWGMVGQSLVDDEGDKPLCAGPWERGEPGVMLAGRGKQPVQLGQKEWGEEYLGGNSGDTKGQHENGKQTLPFRLH